MELILVQSLAHTIVTKTIPKITAGLAENLITQILNKFIQELLKGFLIFFTVK